MDRSKFYGAFNYVIDKLYDENPLVSVALVTPPNLYTTVGADYVQMGNVRSAILALADKYAVPVLDLMKNAGYNPTTMAFRTREGTYSTEEERPRLAQLVCHFLKGIC